MKNIGMWLMILGVGSMGLHFLGYEFTLLMWIENWGPTVGWGIRGALVVVGVVLFVLGLRQVEQTREPA